ncbi:MAG: hypothetical protein PUE51_05790 [Veillonellaceae bacterium]|nr:hypothetical protein [Veillonellaceae bacterium]
MKREDLDKLVRKYLARKELSVSDEIKERREYMRRERARWQDIFEHGCSDPAWPDGCNLNLTQNHIIPTLRSLRDLGEDISGEYIPPEVASSLIIPGGKWFKVRCDRFEHTGQRVQVAGAEIPLF